MSLKSRGDIFSPLLSPSPPHLEKNKEEQRKCVCLLFPMWFIWLPQLLWDWKAAESNTSSQPFSPRHCMCLWTFILRRRKHICMCCGLNHCMLAAVGGGDIGSCDGGSGLSWCLGGGSVLDL